MEKVVEDDCEVEKRKSKKGENIRQYTAGVVKACRFGVKLFFLKKRAE